MDNIYVLGPDGELYHHGTKGMKWGIRRYQNADGSLTAAGKKRYNDELERVKKETSEVKAQQRAQKRTIAKAEKINQAKKELADLKESGKQLTKETKAAVSGKPVKDTKSVKDKKPEKAEKVEKPVETDADKKARLLREPNAKEILENRKLFSDNELNALKLRMDTERNISNFIPAEISKGQQFINKTIETADTVSKVVDSGSKAWNAVAKVSNSLLGTDLPMITEKARTEAEKIKEKAELLEAQNRLKKARNDDPDKPKSELDKIKSEAELEEARNRLKNARKNDPDREKEKTESEKIKEEADLLEAQNRLKNARKNDPDREKEKTESEKIKEEADLLEAQNRLKNARKNDPDREKTDDERARDEYAAETKRINAETARVSAENKRREAANKQKELDEADEEARAGADKKAREANEERSRRAYEEFQTEQARKRASGKTEVVDPDAKSRPVVQNRSLTLYNPQTTAIGKSYFSKTSIAKNNTSSETYKTNTSLISKIHAMTRSGNKSYAEIAKQLGVSVSTVQNYSRGKDTVEKYMTYDENDNFTGYWSAIRDDD